MNIYTRNLLAIGLVALSFSPQISQASPGPCNSEACLIGLYRNGPHGAENCIDATADYFKIIEDDKELQARERKQYQQGCRGSNRVEPQLNIIKQAFGPMDSPPRF